MTTITIDRAVVEQALEALEGWDNYGRWVWPKSALAQAKRNTTESIAALRAALAQPVAHGCHVDLDPEMDKRRTVINKAKELAKAGNHFRFFSMHGEIWECYQAEFLPSIGERSWIAEPIRVYIVHDAPSEAQLFGGDLWSGIK